MKIAIDVSGTLGEKVGINTYITGLVGALAAQDRENEYYLYASFWKDFDKKSRLIEVPDAPNFHALPLRLPERLNHLLEWKLGISLQERFLLGHGVELFHGTGNIIPRFSRIRTVVTNHGYVHNFGLSPEAGKKAWEKHYFRNLVPAALMNADRVIAVSKWTRDSITGSFPVDPARIDVIHIGVDAAMSGPAAELPPELAGEPFLMAIGHSPKKRNIGAILKVYSELLKAGRVSDRLAIINGAQLEGLEGGAYVASLQPLWDELKAAGKLVLTPTLTIGQMAAAYRASSMLVYPSFLEGFGIPIIEAMAAGTPVITSSVPPMSEIGAGGAAVLADPEKPEEIKAAIDALANDPALRARCVELGFAKAAEYSWASAARLTLETYKKAAAK